MTYIIAEPCIDIKDRSCVDVCPVDCIHEAERILVIDPEECIDCFAPTEQLVTSWGLRPVAGCVTVVAGEEGNLETNFGVRSRPIRWLYLATREVFWRVASVEQQEGD